jgi:hypothetical protein
MPRWFPERTQCVNLRTREGRSHGFKIIQGQSLDTAQPGSPSIGSNAICILPLPKPRELHWVSSRAGTTAFASP